MNGRTLTVTFLFKHKKELFPSHYSPVLRYCAKVLPDLRNHSSYVLNTLTI